VCGVLGGLVDGAEMNAGREMDAWIAEHVMVIVWDESRCRICAWPFSEDGCTPESCSVRPAPTVRADEPAHYSTDIAAAWLVIEKIRLGNSMMIDLSCGNGRLGWRCYIRMLDKRTDGHDIESFETANTAPLAICRAAQEAMK
jgi:hypothetical protein